MGFTLLGDVRTSSPTVAQRVPRKSVANCRLVAQPGISNRSATEGLPVNAARFNFGKHYGKPPCEVPSNYLAWVLREVQELDYDLRDAIEVELRIRDAEEARRSRERQTRARHGHRRSAAASEAGAGESATVALPAVVKRWYSTMALEFHPDRGGSSEAMAAINRGRELLEELAGSAA
jgi:hypothetical protein